jgi:thioesterase domain-containing protein
MAADYIEELRRIQPHGPYLIGGFSGGGIAAYEMARQLIAGGEEVAGVFLLDTPLPQLLRFGFADRLMMRYQRIKRGGVRFVLKKLAEKASRFWQPRADSVVRYGEHASNQHVHFQSARIAQAFKRAVDAYEPQPVPVRIMLFRPRLRVQYTITGGRQLTPEYQLALHDNGWSPYGSSVEVFEVPGDHDGMVLEPNVRVLVSSLRRAIADVLADSRGSHT